MPLTYAGYGGKPYESEEEARLSFCKDTGGLTVTDETGTYSSARAQEAARIEREKRGW